jgi:hypothetical protein
MQEAFLPVFLGAGAGGLAGVVVIWIFQKLWGAYLSEKGKNVATKEDVAAITRQVEEVKSTYSLLVEDARAQHQLRMGVLGPRLKAHQEAFALWRKLYRAMHQSNVGDVMNECQAWWEENCLYLEPAVREAFLQAYAAVGYQAVLLDAKDRGEEARAEIRRNRKLIAAFDQTLLKAIDRPPLSTAVQNPLQRRASAEAEAG